MESNEEERYDLYHEKKGIFSKIFKFLFFVGFIALIIYGIMLLLGGCESDNENIDQEEQTEQTEQTEQNDSENSQNSDLNNKDNGSTEVESVTINNDPLKRINFNKVGTVEPFKSATVTSQTSGTITDFEINEGDKVEENQQIAAVEDSVATKTAAINYLTALTSLENAERSLESTKQSVDQDIKMAALGVESAKLNLQNAIDSYNNAILSWDEQIKSAMLGVQSARIGYSGAQESYYNTLTSTETNLEDTIDNSLSSVVSGITLIENVAQLSEQIQNDDDDLLNEYDDIKNDNDVHGTINLIEDLLDALEESQEVLLDLKNHTDDPTAKSSVTALITSIDQSKSGLNMAVQGLNNSLLGAETQPEGAFTGMKSAETSVLSARKALDIARSNQQTQLDSLANAVELSRKQLDSSIAQLENVKAKGNLQVIAAETQLAQIEGQAELAETNLEGTIVKSPIKGTLLQKFSEEGNYVNPSQTIAEIGDMSKVYIIVSLTAEELKFVKLGQDVQIEAPGGITKTGKITKVLPALDPVTKKIRIKILIPNKDQKLISGMFTDVLFSDAQKESVGALVPFKSIIFETNGTFVYVIENNKAVKKSVKLGQIVGSDIEITDGLNQGDKVITKGAKLVNEGDLVKNISDN